MLLPHVLSKINRVGYGMLQPDDLAAAEIASAEGLHMPLSRRLMAVPFVAKDVPSRSSEFAHPDVVIGLSVLAYRYEGLRQSDLREVLLQLKQDYSRQSGPQEQRPASILYNHWLSLSRRDADNQGSHYTPSRQRTSSSLGSLASPEPTKQERADIEEEDLRKCSGVIPLSQLQVLDPIQLRQLYHQLFKLPEVIHHYLCNHVFPRTMNFQRLKVSACGHELGSSILFRRRIGFSGTPSNLLPRDLGECSYEPGSDGKIVSVVSDEKITSAETLPLDWNPRMLLERIATAHPPYHALIDTGALITNMDNHQVAAFLIERLPPQFEGVVYLDSRDRQMVLLRNNGLVVPLSQCGISLARRFTFFDQIHTTGIDIKQAPNAVAVVTLGKDMVFRDYAQGCFRMRGIGKGQRIHVYLIPEVVRRIADTLLPHSSRAHPRRSAIVQIPAWLLVNAMRVEGLQFAKLQQQELSNAFRKVAFGELSADVERNYSKIAAHSSQRRCHVTEYQRSRRFTKSEVLTHSIEEFREVIEFVVSNRVAPPEPFVEQLQRKVEAKPLTLPPLLRTVVQETLQRISSTQHRGNDADGAEGRRMEVLLGYNAEVVHEQEAEEEQEQEAEQEEQRVSAFTRDDEESIPWHIDSLAAYRGDAAARASSTATNVPRDQQMEVFDPAFYPVSRFQVRPQQPLLTGIPSSFAVSDNFFKLRWCEGQHLGDRRLKNCILFVEWVSGQPLDSPVERRRYFGVVSLAEGETVRWLIHHPAARGGRSREMPLCLRSVATGATLDAAGVPGRAAGGDTQPAADVSLPSMTATPMDAPTLWFRFLNNDMFYDADELRVLEEVVLSAVPLPHRLTFFSECLRLRRRHRNSWEDAPVAQLFATADEEKVLKALPIFKKLSTAIGKLQAQEDAAASDDQKPEEGKTVFKKHLFDRFVELFKQQAKSDAATGQPVLDVASAARVMETCFAFPSGWFSTQDIIDALLYIRHVGKSSASGASGNRRVALSEILSVVPSMVAYFTPKEQRTAEQAGSAPTKTLAEALQEMLGYWACSVCTAHNDLQSKTCDVCGAFNAVGSKAEPSQEPWFCPQCTFRNPSSANYCEMCQYDSGRKPAEASPMPSIVAPEGYWVCSPEKGGCSKFNANSLFYCEVCDKARPDLAAVRF